MLALVNGPLAIGASPEAPVRSIELSVGYLVGSRLWIGMER